MVIRLYVNQGSYIKPGKIYRDENTVYRFIKKVLKEVKYCKWIIKYHFKKELKKNKRHFRKTNKCRKKMLQ